MNSFASRTMTVLYLVLIIASAFGYQPQRPKNAQIDRRNFLAFVTASATANVLLMPEQPANAIISSKYCAYGSGDGCDDLAEGNELIRQLQAKSAANKEKNESVCTQERGNGSR